MVFQALHRLRRRSRGIAAATVAVFALNWLGLALTPCAMASVAPSDGVHAAMAGAPAAAPAANFDADALAAMPPDCRARMLAAAGHPADGGPTSTNHDAPCPWCLAGGASAAGPHATGCDATAKPALDTRDVQGFHSPLLVALSATVLALVPLDVLAPRAVAAEPALPPDLPALDRYCRRLE